MALFYRDDDVSYESYEEGRPTGFRRYTEMLGSHWFDWMRSGIVTTIGLLPLMAAIGVSVLATSILLLIPLSFLGGMIAAPFYSAYHDVFLRSIRYGRGTWFEQYKTGWKQNWKSSLLPGGIIGILIGSYTFMGFLLYWRVTSIPLTTVIMYFISGIILITGITVYMPLSVLFEQTPKNRLINIIAYTSRYFFKVLSMSILQMIILTLTVMFAPWSLFLVPIAGWYFRFLVIHKLYDSLNEYFSIEELIQKKQS